MAEYDYDSEDLPPAGLIQALKDGLTIEVWRDDPLAEILRLAREWMEEPSFADASERTREFTEDMVKLLEAELLSDEGGLEDSDGEPDTHNDTASSP